MWVCVILFVCKHYSVFLPALEGCHWEENADEVVGCFLKHVSVCVCQHIMHCIQYSSVIVEHMVCE